MTPFFIDKDIEPHFHQILGGNDYPHMGRFISLEKANHIIHERSKKVWGHWDQGQFYSVTSDRSIFGESASHIGYLVSIEPIVKPADTESSLIAEMMDVVARAQKFLEEKK